MYANEDPQLEQEIPTNQTQFELEEPLFEKAYKPEKPSLNVDNEMVESAPQVWWRQRKFLLIGGGVVSVILVILLLLVAVMSQSPVAPPVAVEPQATAQPVTQDGFQQRLKEAKDALDQADPADNEFPIPPVDYDFRLVEVKRQ